MTRRPLLLAAVALGLAAPAAAAQAPGLVPQGSVVQVEGQPTITREELDHWVRVAGLSEVQGSREPSSALPAEGTKAWRGLVGQAAQFLISSRWITGETARRGITVSENAVWTAFARTRERSFPDRTSYLTFLALSGMTQDDLLLRVRQDLLSQRLRAQVVRAAPSPTRADALAYYARNRRGFAGPERRVLRLVLTTTQRRARAALAARRAGRSWAAVARTYSIDEITRRAGGRTTTTRGMNEAPLEKAIFAARRGVLNGPIRTQFGWYVFEVTAITPARPPRFASSERAIRQLLTAERRQDLLDRFLLGFRARWTARTACALPGGVTTPDCGTGSGTSAAAGF